MIRIWNIQKGQLVTSYLLSKSKSLKGSWPKITCATIDDNEKYLAIANELGEISIHNIHSIGVLHILKINTEVTNMKFFIGATNLWLAATCWEGKVAMFNVPAFT